MIQFCNAQYEKPLSHDFDLFICTISYEQRSYFLLDQIIQSLDKENALIFATDNYRGFDIARAKVDALQEMGYDVNVINYLESTLVIESVISAIQKAKEKKQSVKIVVDYSSMPRNWYSRLPDAMETVLGPEDIAYFWYCEGNYPGGYEEYPTAGIEKLFEYFSGKASLLPKKRAHVFALSYDAVRTQGIIEKIEPDYVIVCEAHDPTRSDVLKNVTDANENLIAQAAMSVSLDISDFSFMVTKLRELANELIKTTDVVFVPDGPKPLILAMSQVPSLLNRPGITCIHAKRNLDKFVPVNVTASGKVVGFSVRVIKEENPNASMFVI